MTLIRRPKSVALVLFMATGLALAAVAVLIMQREPVAVAIAQRSVFERDKVIERISKGDILYIRSEHYIRDRPPFFMTSDIRYPDRLLQETWIGTGPDGFISQYVILLSDLDGKSLNKMVLDSGDLTYTDLASGQIFKLPFDLKTRMDEWLVALWDFQTVTADRSFRFAGYGTLDGQETAMFEKEYQRSATINGLSDTDDRPRRSKIEFAVDNPLIWSSKLSVVEADGTESLLQEYRAVDVQLLPSETPLGIE